MAIVDTKIPDTTKKITEAAATPPINPGLVKKLLEALSHPPLLTFEFNNTLKSGSIKASAKV